MPALMATACSIAPLRLSAVGDKLQQNGSNSCADRPVAALHAKPLEPRSSLRFSRASLQNTSRQAGRFSQQSCKAASCPRSSYLGTAFPAVDGEQKAPSNGTQRSNRTVTMRLKGEHSFTIKGDIEKVFGYASDFTHIDAWDPGTPESWKEGSLTRSKQAPIGVGTQFNLRTILLGYITPTVYEIMEFQPPRFVKFYGVSDFHDSWDSIWFQRDERDPDLVRIHYVSEMRLTSWYKYFEGVMSWLLIRVFKDAVEGLEKKMKSMEPEFQKEPATAEPATAGR